MSYAFNNLTEEQQEIYVMSLDRGYTPAAATAPAAPAGKPTGVIPVAGVSQGTIDLVNVDEKTAAIIMAIVSDKSGIPLNRLSFKSIKLVEDNK